jgi:hypothetical protein
MSRSLPERPSLEQLRKQAKSLLRSAREQDEAALRYQPGAVPATGVAAVKRDLAISCDPDQSLVVTVLRAGDGALADTSGR